MPQILIDPEEVKGIGRDVKRKKDEIDGVIENAKSIVERLRGGFKGRRSQRFFEEWEQIAPKLKDSIQTIQHAGDLLERAAADFESTDNA